MNKGWLCRDSENGYVTLEFALAMGMIIFPTMLILLQIPIYLEQNNRLDAIAATVANRCAVEAQNTADGNRIAVEMSADEKSVNSTLRNVNIESARCVFENSELSPGSIVTAEIRAELPPPVIPGLSSGPRWVKVSQHSSVIPKYRSFN